MKKLMAAVLAGLMLAGLLSGCASTANDEKSCKQKSIAEMKKVPQNLHS